MNIALIGLGEVGRVLAEDLADGCTLSAWDTAFAEPDSRAAHNARELPVRVATGAAEVLKSPVSFRLCGIPCPHGAIY